MIKFFLPTRERFDPIVVENSNLDKLYIEAMILNRRGFMSWWRTFEYIGANTGNVRYISWLTVTDVSSTIRSFPFYSCFGGAGGGGGYGFALSMLSVDSLLSFKLSSPFNVCI